MAEDAKNISENSHRMVRQNNSKSHLSQDDDNEDKITWKAPEFVFREKSADWYWILGIVVVTVIIVALLLNNILFALLTLIAGSALALYGSKKPEILTHQVNERGIQIESRLYPYSTLDFFWIDDTGETSLLLVESKKKVMRLIVFPIEGVRSSELREYLAGFLPEEHIERPWTEMLMERLGF